MNALAHDVLARHPTDVLAFAIERHLWTRDRFERYWLGAVLDEIRETHDMPYRHALGVLLERLLAGELVVVTRCRGCAHFFAQPTPAMGQWRAYCEHRCRDRYYHMTRRSP